MRDQDGDNNGLDLSLPAVKTIDEFEESLDKLQRLYRRSEKISKTDGAISN